jgi:hypothetical protein
MMTLDEAIKHCEEVADEKNKEACNLYDAKNYEESRECIWCSEEHRQLAEWLKDYKRLKKQEPFKNAYINYIKQAAKERDIAIGQLNELGYSFGEKIRPCDKESENEECRGCPYNDGEVHAECVIENVIAEIDRQGEWLEEAGYNAYNVDIAFGSIIRALRKWLTPHR